MRAWYQGGYGQGCPPWGPGSSWGWGQGGMGPMRMGMGGGFMGNMVRTLTALSNRPDFDPPPFNRTDEFPTHQDGRDDGRQMLRPTASTSEYVSCSRPSAVQSELKSSKCPQVVSHSW